MENIAMTCVALTNVIVTVGIYNRWSVAAEIFLILAYVARTNFDLTNVTMTIEICSR